MMYEWLEARLRHPAHGEAVHIAEHPARAHLRRPNAVLAKDGAMVRLAPGKAEIIDHIKVGAVYKGRASRPPTRAIVPIPEEAPKDRQLRHRPKVGISHRRARPESRAIRLSTSWACP